MTAPYSKPCASHKYVPPQSCHDRKVIEAIPYSVFYRIRLLSSNDRIFEEAAKEYFQYLSNSGYEEQTLKMKLDKVRKLSRFSMLQDGKKTTNRDFVAALVLDSQFVYPI